MYDDDEDQDPAKDIPMGNESVYGCNHKQFSGQVKALKHLGENHAHAVLSVLCCTLIKYMLTFSAISCFRLQALAN